MRIQHLLKGNSKNERPNNVFFVDTETTLKQISPTEQEHDFLFGHASFYRLDSRSTKKDITFTKVSDFWEWVFSIVTAGKKYTFFAHNASFDFRVLQGFTYLDKHNYYIHTLIDSASNFILSANKNLPRELKTEEDKKQKTKIKTAYFTFLSTTNFFQFPLSLLGDYLGLPKLEYKHFREISEEAITYCKRDVEILEKITFEYFRFLDKHNCGNFRPTIASQSLNTYKHRFLENPIEIHTKENAIKLERESYFGGRTEAYRIGIMPKENYYYLDINSMYPYVMREKTYPTKLLKTYNRLTLEEIIHACKIHTCISYGKVKTNIPCTPKRHDKRLTFPTGEFYTALCYPELKLLLDEGGEFYPIHTSIYEHGNIFKSYVDYWYSQRLHYRELQNDLYTFYTKIFQNSLYGKFGQKIEKWKLYEKLDESYTNYERIYDPDLKKEVAIKHINGYGYKKVGEEEGYDSFVAIASFVTSYARVLLYEYQKIAGRKNVYYSDTDSLIVNEQGYKNLHSLIDSKKLGFLKLESESKHLEIYGAKDYIFEGDCKIKGISKKAIKINENRYQCQQWEKLTSAIHKGNTEKVKIYTIQKELSRDYKKGTVNKEGIVYPLTLFED